jgi:REP element-mobilizing transposase RayT
MLTFGQQHKDKGDHRSPLQRDSGIKQQFLIIIRVINFFIYNLYSIYLFSAKANSMEYFHPDFFHRKSIRFFQYDYSQSGLYFITICCKDKKCLLGHIHNGEMILNNFGKIANDEWIASHKIRKEIFIHDFVVMPNHIHGIVQIVIMEEESDGTINSVKLNLENYHFPKGPVSKSLSAMIAGYKAKVTSKINQMTGLANSVWQRNYYEHIIRNDTSLSLISNYIRNNPQQWEKDRFFND